MWKARKKAEPQIKFVVEYVLSSVITKMYFVYEYFDFPNGAIEVYEKYVGNNKVP